MKKYTFDDIRERNLLLYEYVRGSTLYGLNTPDSDVDTAGVFLAPAEQLLGLGLDYQEDISDERHDTTWFEMNKFMKMLLKSNPTVLESLFVPKDKVIGEIHPIMQYLIDNRDMFVTKECFKPFGGYAVEQIRKMRGLNKKIVNPVTERLQPLDFAYTFKLQGSTKIKNWLDYRGLKQQYCGLVHIPNMHNTYGVYYDWGNHFLNEGISQYDIENGYIHHDEGETDLYKMGRFLKEYTKEDSISNAFAYINTAPIGYRGMVGEDGLSNELRLSSVSKGEVPICHMCYNKDGYTSHCIDYKDYQDWVKFRNPKRYESNLEKNYDCYVDSETEFLTDNGWKKYDEVLDTDLMACFNDKHEILYKPFLSRTDDMYSGKIYTYESSYLKFSITENHKLYLSPCHRTIYNGFSTKYDKERNNWSLLPVKDYFNGKRSYFHQLNNLVNNKPDNELYSDDFIKLLGMFLSEGCFVFNNKSTEPTGIRISQTNDRCGCSVMNSISTIKLSEYLYDGRDKGKEHTWECNDKDILKLMLKCNGRYSTEKDIPNYVYTFSKRQFDLLLEAMLCGDGTSHIKGHSIYYTYSKKMAKSLHTLLMINNYNAQMYGGDTGYIYDYPSNFKRKDGVINGSYQIFISKNNSQYHVLNKMEKKKNCGWSFKDVTNERIVCFETEYGTLVTRNNHKMCFHGNSKNCMHSFRLMNMCIEIAKGESVKLDRTSIDREFLMDIRNHKFEYDEIADMIDKKKEEMDLAISQSNIPEKIDVDLVNDLLINIRKKQLLIE